MSTQIRNVCVCLWWSMSFPSPFLASHVSVDGSVKSARACDWVCPCYIRARCQLLLPRTHYVWNMINSFKPFDHHAKSKKLFLACLWRIQVITSPCHTFNTAKIYIFKYCLAKRHMIQIWSRKDTSYDLAMKDGLVSHRNIMWSLCHTLCSTIENASGTFASQGIFTESGSRSRSRGHARNGCHGRRRQV